MASHGRNIGCFDYSRDTHNFLFMNPIVLIATHNRYEITSYNVESLLKQSVKPKVILVVSRIEEKIYYQNKFPGIIVLMYGNTPLAAKWQFGVQHAYNLKADPLIILGSDDILGADYIQKVCKLLPDHDFIGTKHWYIHYKTRAYYAEYLAYLPLGGGRAYSYRALKQLDGVLFDVRLNRHLDDYAYNQLKNEGIECYVDTTLELHAVKGDWPVMNNVNLTHPNIRVISNHESIELLPGLY